MLPTWNLIHQILFVVKFEEEPGRFKRDIAGALVVLFGYYWYIISKNLDNVCLFIWRNTFCESTKVHVQPSLFRHVTLLRIRDTSRKTFSMPNISEIW